LVLQGAVSHGARRRARQGRHQVISEHRRAKFDFDIDETLEAGLELMGSEVKRCATARPT